MREKIDVAGSEDEAAAELKGIFAEPVLAMSGGLGARPRDRIVATRQVEQRARLETGDPVGLPIGVDEQGKLIPVFSRKAAA